MKTIINNKFTSRHFGPYKVLKRIGSMAYRLKLPATAKVDNTFHVSLLKQKISPNNIAQHDPPLPVSFPTPPYPTKILDRKLINRNNGAVVSVLVQWEGMEPEDATWIDYDHLCRSYPQFVGEYASNSREGHCHK